MCQETGAIIEDATPREHVIKKLRGLQGLLHNASCPEDRAVIIRELFDGAGRLSHFDRMAQKAARELDSAIEKVESTLQDREQALSFRIRHLESRPDYVKLQQVI